MRPTSSPRSQSDRELALIADLAALRRPCPVPIDVTARVLARVRHEHAGAPPLSLRAIAAAAAVFVLFVVLFASASVGLARDDDALRTLASTAMTAGSDVLAVIVAMASSLARIAIETLARGLAELWQASAPYRPVIGPAATALFVVALLGAVALVWRDLRRAPLSPAKESRP